MEKQDKLKQELESLLFITARPLSLKKLTELTGTDKKEVREAIAELINDYQARKNSGIKVMKVGESYQMSTAGESRSTIEKYIKDEITGELTKPSQETLSIIAYRGPISKTELEQIRGVNCSLILRNLIIRGLVEAQENKEKMQTYYQITFDFLRYLGINSQQELPDYEKLSSDEIIQKYLMSNEEAE